MRLFTFILFLALYSSSIAQQAMRPIDDLINTTDPGWTTIKKLMDSATNKLEVLPVDSTRAKKALYELQVTSRSSIGAVVLNTGGILIDQGWIRIIGSGGARLDRELMQWNKELYKSQNPGFLVVADDAIGGFFLMNGGGLGDDIGNLYYLSPDNLEFEPMEIGYTDFLSFCFNSNLEEYYKGYRWKKWKTDVAALPGNKVFNFFPMLFTKEGKDIENVSKKAISVDEQFFLHLDLRRQLGLEKQDTIGHE